MLISIIKTIHTTVFSKKKHEQTILITSPLLGFKSGTKTTSDGNCKVVHVIDMLHNLINLRGGLQCSKDQGLTEAKNEHNEEH